MKWPRLSGFPQKPLRNGAGSGKRFRSYVLVQGACRIDSVILTPGSRSGWFLLAADQWPQRDKLALAAPRAFAEFASKSYLALEACIADAVQIPWASLSLPATRQQILFSSSRRVFRSARSLAELSRTCSNSLSKSCTPTVR